MGDADPDLSPLALAQALVRRPSVTPADCGAQDLVADALVALGFRIRRLTFGAAPDGPVRNLYARLGAGAPHFCFAGHTDVVPPGPASGWSCDPFAGLATRDVLVGRGAADMKGAIAAFIVAVRRFLAAAGQPFQGSISLLITGDEEGPAFYGTDCVLGWMETEGERPDHCLVGEPTSALRLGDTVKIGRRGSLNADIVVHGVQGHVAYPARADNPIDRLVNLLRALKARRLDAGDDWFEPSNLEVTDLMVGNPTENLIPASARARINIRFNTQHRSAELIEWLKAELSAAAPSHDLVVRVSGEAYLTPPDDFTRLVRRAVADITGLEPALSTSGGTSDARFIRRVCPVVEFGLPGASMHKADEQVRLSDLDQLAAIYTHILQRYFASRPVVE